jgi:flagellar hook-associated protein 2
MSSPITLSNFNNIDFSVILNAVMAQASQPLNALQAKQTSLASENSAYSALASRLGSLETAAAALSTTTGNTEFTSTLSDTGSIGVTDTGNGVAGTYDVIVSKLAKSQVSASSSTTVDAGTTIVANAGTLTIGGVDVEVTGDLTLAGLASQINATKDMAVTASVVRSAPGAFRLVLTSNDTGLANAFVVGGSLTGGTGVAFGGVPSQDADDAAVSVNGVDITSSSNTLTSVIPGTTISLLHADLTKTKTTTVSVKADDSALVNNVKEFVSSYNDVIAFITAQSKADANGQPGALAHASLVSQARSALRSALGGTYGSGINSHLAEIGIGFNQTGQLTLTTGTLSAALAENRASVVTLFAGSGLDSSGFTTGAFGTVQSAIDQFTRAGGFVASAQSQLSAQGTRLDTQISEMNLRLAAQRTTLQQQYTAADQAMTQLKSQSGTLSGMTSLMATG